MLGSLTLYRRILLENIFSKSQIRPYIPFSNSSQLQMNDLNTLPSFGHGIAGLMAGITVSFVAAPVEHIKNRLQVQYSAVKSNRMYSGPIDCVRKVVCPLSPFFLFIYCNMILTFLEICTSSAHMVYQVYIEDS